nr:replication factor A protein 1-like [Ipomoea batatas]
MIFGFRLEGNPGAFFRASGNQIKCTLWDDHVGKIEPFFNASSHDPVVVILQFCRIRTDVTNGEVRLCSTYDVTQVFINQQSQEFLEFRERLSLRGVQTPMRSIASFPSLNYDRMMEQTESPAQDMKTIDEIYQTREDFSSKVENQMVDDDDLEEFAESDEEESSLGVGVAGNQDGVGDRDEFSTTQTSKNKGILNVKLEGGK